MQFVDNNVIGADVSFYQDNNETPQQIDFTKMVGQGASYVIVRAGQNEWVDPDFLYNWTKAKAAGLPRGSYWFYDSRKDPVKQAEIFASLFSVSPPELELWLDLEESYNGAYQGWQNWKKFLIRLKQLMPSAKIGIYTGYYYITGKIPPSEYLFFAEFVLWIAWYSTNPANVLIPRPWTSCLYWQWGTPSWGLAWGCESIEIDMNKFNGTKQQFVDRYGAVNPTQEEPIPGGTMTTITIYHLTTTEAAKKWSNIACTNRIYPDFQNNAKLEAVLKSGGNYKLRDGSCVKGTQVHEDYTTTETTGGTTTPPTKTLTHTIRVYDDGSITVDA